MQIIQFNTSVSELPLQITLSMEPMFEGLESFAAKEDHPYHKSAKLMLKELEAYPELREGVDTFDELEKYEKAIELLTEPLFPAPLQTNEIKAIMIPFRYIAFRPTLRFSNILKNAGPDYKLEFVDFEEDTFYFLACSFILGKYYKQPLKYSRPLFVEIPDQRSGITRHYRILFNADFAKIEKMDTTPELTDEDINELLLGGEDLELWKSKFPPNSYRFRGFGIINLYDATLDVAISKIRSLFLRNDNHVFDEFRDQIRTLYGIKDLQVGYSVYNTHTHEFMGSFMNKDSFSLFIEKDESGDYGQLFCEGINRFVMNEHQTRAIPDLEQYGEISDHNPFFKKLYAKGIQSIILSPIPLDNGFVQLLELASPRKNELNSLNALKLQDITPFIKIAAERYFEESQNLMESTIQENYTSIHPSVKWRFIQAAAKFNRQKSAGNEVPALEVITFDNIYPLYGQSDIKGSSNARNNAIKADLELQLSLVIDTFQKVIKKKPMPIYENLIFRVDQYLDRVKDGLHAGDEVNILEFLKNEIYPVFNHLKTVSPAFTKAVDEYMKHIDPELNVVYKKRKAYEDSVSIINEQLSALLDQRQEDAQQMFPHYFQRYNTDGVEYNMYIGDSLVENKKFDRVYLQNLRLWQLETMWDIEQKAFSLLEELPHPLRVASLILIHSNPLAIKFKMDEKQFDVDGAYNARYEIIKKRIDKSYIKGTNERLTQPGKIAIVYSQDRDALEYRHYIEYLQGAHKFGELEMLDLEDLQGVSGLKAMRVEVLYREKKEKGKRKKEVTSDVNV